MGQTVHGMAMTMGMGMFSIGTMMESMMSMGMSGYPDSSNYCDRTEATPLVQGNLEADGSSYSAARPFNGEKSMSLITCVDQRGVCTSGGENGACL